MRVFVALSLPSPALAGAGEIQARLRREYGGIRWVEPNRFHITLSFLGEVERKDLSCLSTAVRELVRGREALRLSFGGVGFFPERRRARIIFLEFEEGREKLASLLQACRRIMTAAGFLPAGGDPRPHLTLGRCRSERDFASDELPITAGDAFLAEEVCLYESVLTPQGPHYRPLGREVLTGKAETEGGNGFG